jgi:hypothetical protein
VVLCLATLAPTALAAAPAAPVHSRKRAAGRPPPQEQSTTAGAPALSVASVRLQLGVGGGRGEAAGRAGLQLDLWPVEPFGIGLVGASTVSGTFGDGGVLISLVGPALSLRSEPGDGYLRSTLVLGAAYWHCSWGVCEEGAARRTTTIGAELMVGYAGNEGVFGFGWHAGLLVARDPDPAEGMTYFLTLNLDLGLEL